MTAHKHAEFLNAIAGGDDITKWQCRKDSWDVPGWSDASSWLPSITINPNLWETRRKPEPPKTETRTYECWDTGFFLSWPSPGNAIGKNAGWKRVPSEDKVCEVTL
jgi:hypothetical protein